MKFSRETEERDDSLLVVPPGLGDRRMAGIPFCGKGRQVSLCLFDRWSIVDALEVGRNLLALLPGDIAQSPLQAE
jgi:hypothetical protein